MIYRELFWDYVKIGLLLTRTPMDKAIRALARVQRNEIDVFIGGYDTSTPPEIKAKELALKAVEYVSYVNGASAPAWFQPFIVNWPD